MTGTCFAIIHPLAEEPIYEDNPIQPAIDVTEATELRFPGDMPSRLALAVTDFQSGHSALQAWMSP